MDFIKNKFLESLLSFMEGWHRYKCNAIYFVIWSANMSMAGAKEHY